MEDATDAILKFLQSPLDANSLCISGENIEITYILENIKKIFNKLTGKSLNFFEKKSANKRSLYLVPPPVLDDRYSEKHTAGSQSEYSTRASRTFTRRS